MFSPSSQKPQLGPALSEGNPMHAFISCFFQCSQTSFANLCLHLEHQSFLFGGSYRSRLISTFCNAGKSQYDC
jgi:hypothetical protein